MMMNLFPPLAILKTTDGKVTPRVVFRVLAWFAMLCASFLLLAFLLNENKKTRLKYKQWCEDRGYAYSSYSRTHYCRDRSSGVSFQPPSL